MSDGCHCDNRGRQIDARLSHLFLCLRAVTVTTVVAKSVLGNHSLCLPLIVVLVTTVVAKIMPAHYTSVKNLFLPHTACYLTKLIHEGNPAKAHMGTR